MKCPFCNGSDTQVIDSRVSEEGDTIRRRRRCAACDRRFTTYERVELTMPAVVKRNGTRTEGELVMNELIKLDQVAYVRFASVYKSFEDIGEFVKAIDEIKVEPASGSGKGGR